MAKSTAATSVTRHLPYRCQTVFDTALTAQACDRDGERRTLEIRPIWGMRGEVGAQTVIRRPFGSYDLEMLETIVSIDRPLHFAADEKPLRLVPYNPHERVPPLDVDDRPPEKVFAQTFGEKPIVQRLTFDLAPRQGGADLTIGLVAAEPLGWMRRKLWIRQSTKAINAALDDIARQLNETATPSGSITSS